MQIPPVIVRDCKPRNVGENSSAVPTTSPTVASHKYETESTARGCVTLHGVQSFGQKVDFCVYEEKI